VFGRRRDAPLHDIAETAEYLQVSPHTVRRLITDGELTGYRTGRSRRTIRIDLNEGRRAVDATH
jgi:excisionase family DNA binding protein